MRTPETQRGPRSSWELMACLLAISTLTAGCGQSQDPDSAGLPAVDVAARYGYDTSSAAMSPVFALVPEYKDPKDGHARDVLASKCLEGVVEYRAVAPGSSASLIDERTGQLTFDEDVAAQWGYPQLRLPTSADSAVPEGVEITPAIHEAMVRCGEQADERLGLPPERLLNSIELAGWDAVAADAEVRQAVSRSRECMAPAGVVDLPDAPNEMPPASVVTPGSQTQDAQGNLVGVANSLPSARERQVATLDAQCRASSGYDVAVLQARADAELTAIGQDVDGFEAARSAYQEYEKKLDEVVAELG